MNQEVVLILMQVLALVMAFSVHECAHAWTAWRLGDPTAKMLGRVTLNPIKHLDPFGSVLMPLVALVYHWPLIGWAKPTPVTARNFKNYRRDDILVTVAGPISNLLLASAALIFLLILKHVIAGGNVAVLTAMALAAHYPVSTENLPAMFPLALLFYYIILINLLLFVFNLIPFPPLDGSRILRHFLPYNALEIYDRMGIFALWIFMFLAGGFIFRTFLDPLESIFDRILAFL
ncbi:MAG TPA: site-2 protease family protein [Edaphobacter sp.]